MDHFAKFFVRINDDESFRAAFQSDPVKTMTESGLTAAEQVLIMTHQHDALHKIKNELLARGASREGAVEVAISAAWGDAAFRDSLRENPKAALATKGVKIPDNVKVHVHEDTLTDFHLVIPSSPDEYARAANLKEGEILDAPSTFTCYTCTCCVVDAVA